MKKRRKKNSKITFLVIPQAADSPLQASFTRKTLMMIIILAGLIIISGGIISFLYFDGQAELKSVNALKKDNYNKDETIQQLTKEIEEIEEQQLNISNKQAEIKQLMGIEAKKSSTVKPSRGGQGGDERTNKRQEDVQPFYLAQNIKTTLAKQEKELDDMIAAVNNNTTYFRRVPNQWPVEGEISSEIGWRKSPFGGRGESFHDGIDIAGDSGTEIVAAGDGTVIFTGWQPVYGKTIIIEHGYGFKTKYSHNSAILVNEGEKVKKGQLVAKMGSTGRSTGPHLHFSVYKEDNPQNPLIYLPLPEKQ